MLLGPVAGELGAKRLLIVADGFLHYFPFDALPEPVAESETTSAGPEPLFLKHEVIAIPSAMTLAALQGIGERETVRGKAVAVFADPVFEKNDPRVLMSSTALHPTRFKSRCPLRNFLETDRLEKFLAFRKRYAKRKQYLRSFRRAKVSSRWDSRQTNNGCLMKACETFAFCISRRMAC